MIAARLQISRVRVEGVIVSVRIFNPLAFYGIAFEEWSRALPPPRNRWGLAEAAGPGAVIVANSTPDMRQFRGLLSNGYRDAVEQTGAGYATTLPSYPAFPVFVTVDSVLTQHAAVPSIRTIEVSGFDHRGLRVTVDLPRGRS